MDLVKLTETLSTSHLRSYRDDDLFVDRISHRYSVVAFTIFAILVTTKAYIGDPIDCWAPPEFKASYERYAETLCFVNGTYFISANQIEIPNDDKRYSNRIRYYQWTPFILLFQAFLMYAPRVLWLSLNTRYGLNIRNLVDAAKKYESVDCYKNKLKILTYLCKNLLRNVEYTDYIKNKPYIIQSNKKDNTNTIFNSEYFNRKSEIHQIINKMQIDCDLELLVNTTTTNTTNTSNEQTFDMINHRINMNDDFNRKFLQNMKTHQIKPSYGLSLRKIFYDNYLTTLYLFVRFVYLVSFIGQYLFLSHLIGNEFYKIGINLIMSFYNQIEWPQIKIFPRLTFCEIYIREIGTVHPYLIQCVLRINLFNEVIFIVVWFWLMFLILLSSFDFMWRFMNNILRCSSCTRKSFALKYLELINNNNSNSSSYYDFDSYLINTVNNQNKKILIDQNLYNLKRMQISSNKIEIKKVMKRVYNNKKNSSNNSTNNRSKKQKSNKKALKEENSFDTLVNEIFVIEHQSNKIMMRQQLDKTNEQDTYVHSKNEKDESNKLLNQTMHDEIYHSSVDKELDLFERFCFNYFNNDTIFALNIIEKNASSLIVSEIIEYLWIHYKGIYFNNSKNISSNNIKINNSKKIQNNKREY